MAEYDCPLCKPNQQPTAKLLAAIAEVEDGEVRCFSTVEELIADLHAADDDQPAPDATA